MDVTLLFKLWTDLFLYGSAAGLFFPMEDAVPSILLCGLLAAVPVLVRRSAKRKWICAASGVVPLLCLLAVGGRAFWGMVPAAVYAGYAAASGRVLMDREEFLRYFRPYLVIGGMTAVLAPVLSPSGASEIPLLYTAAVFFGMMTLRCMRHAPEVRRSRGFFLLTGAVPAAIVAGAYLLWRLGALRLLGAGVAALYRTVLLPVLTGIAYVAVGIGYVLTRVLEWLLSGRAQNAEEQTFELQIEEAEEQLGLAAGETSALAESVLTALAILAGIAAAVLLFRALLGRRRPAAQASGTEGKTERLGETRKGSPRALFSGRLPEEQVRRAFRKAMRLAERKGAVFEDADTSESIAEKSAAFLDGKTFGALRKIYLKARYDPEGTDRSSAAQAKNLYEALRRGPGADGEKRGGSQ